MADKQLFKIQFNSMQLYLNSVCYNRKCLGALGWGVAGPPTNGWVKEEKGRRADRDNRYASWMHID